MRKGVKAQISLEFMMYLGLSTLILMAFIVSNTQKVIELNKEKERLMVEDLSNYIQAEMFIAYNAHHGYERQFELPADIKGLTYNITIDGGFLFIDSPNYNSVTKVVDVSVNTLNTGNIVNTIKNNGGKVEIN